MPRKKTTKKVNKTSKAKKLKSLSQTHGKKETHQATTLDQIWGEDGTSKYKTMDEGKYLSSIEGMDRTDLHSHAVTVGIIPVDNRDTLTQRLMREFRKHVASYKTPKGKNDTPKISSDIQKILNEGK